MNFQASIKTVDKQINNDLKNLSNWLNANKIALNPVDTGRKLNVHKTFRRRPGRSIYVLCLLGIYHKDIILIIKGYYQNIANELTESKSYQAI